MPSSPQRGTGSGDRVLRRWFVQCCFTSTQIVRTVRDGEPRTSTSSSLICLTTYRPPRLVTLRPLISTKQNTASIRAYLLSCCLTSTEARWPIRDGDRVGRGRESERLDRGNRPKKTGETVDRRQNNGSVKAVSPRHCPATCALRNCSFNCCAGQSH